MAENTTAATESGLKVLVTGAHGLIGNLVYARLAAQPAAFDVYGMVRRDQPSKRAAAMTVCEIPAGRRRMADLTDPAAVQAAVTGMDVVVHMAADPDGSAGWESVLDSNIVGAYHLFEACRLAGVKRIVYASTNQVVFGYSADEPYAAVFKGDVDALDPNDFQPIEYTQVPRPINYYACSKVFGESLAHMYARQHGISCICLRIGWVTADDRVPGPHARSLWCSQRDIVQLVERCILAPPELRFDVFFGQSANPYNLVQIAHTREVLGYAPQDNAEDQLA